MMVSLVEIQTAYYLVAATGVLVAAIYYIMNMRYNIKAREMELCSLFTKEWTSEEGMKRYAKVMTFDWKDYDDFMKKYGYTKPEEFGTWVSQFFATETMGLLIKSGVVDAEKLYYLGGYGVIRMWEKYKDIIAGRRGVSWGHDYMINTEFVANECSKIKMRHDESFKEKLEEFKKTGRLE